ncbi:MAG TPA: hypothetical protein VD866_20975 [Urbifossiella sp.]|nr:hypothetical protein [Urbifossiella sp.]
MTLRTWLRPRPAHTTAPRPRTRLGVQHLEAREVPATGLLSAFSLGDAVGSVNAQDVAADAAGNSYLTGSFTGTVDFDPTDAADAADTLTARGADGVADAFVAKYAADNALVWVRRMGGDTHDRADQVAVDAAGNVYVCGDFTGAGDFGPTALGSAGGSDGFVVKLNAAGVVQLAKRWGGVHNDTGVGVGTDAAGSVYALGTRNTGSSSSAGNGYDILKFATRDRDSWAKSIPTQKNPFSGGGFAVDAAGNTFVGGVFLGLVDFDPGSGSKLLSAGTTSYSGFVLKLTAAGNYGWVSGFSGGGSYVSHLAVDGAGGVVLNGYCGAGVTFRPYAGGPATAMPVGQNVVTKLNAAGGLVWTRGSAGDTSTSDLAVDAAGNIYLTGSFSGTVDFDPGVGAFVRSTAAGISQYSTDVYVMKLTAAGDFAWAGTFGGTGMDWGTGVAVDPTGTVYLAGYFAGTVDFDPDPLGTFDLTNPGTKRNSFLVKLAQS